MFANIGWGEFLILVIAGLVILGPERLPEAFLWVAKALSTAKEYLTNARSQFEQEYGTDFKEFAEPLAQLNQLRGMSPRAVITRHLLDGDDGFLTSIREIGQDEGSTASAPTNADRGATSAASVRRGATSNAAAIFASTPSAPRVAPSAPASQTSAFRFDPDAT